MILLIGLINVSCSSIYQPDVFESELLRIQSFQEIKPIEEPLVTQLSFSKVKRLNENICFEDVDNFKKYDVLQEQSIYLKDYSSLCYSANSELINITQAYKEQTEILVDTIELKNKELNLEKKKRLNNNLFHLVIESGLLLTIILLL